MNDHQLVLLVLRLLLIHVGIWFGRKLFEPGAMGGISEAGRSRGFSSRLSTKEATMAAPCYTLTCIHGVPGSWTTSSRCTQCGQPGQFAFWRLGMHQAMARYQYVYGLKPIGPHRKAADELLGGLRRTCPECNGEGVLSLDGPRRWKACPTCEATGGFWTCSDDERRVARERVLAEFPMPRPPTRPVSSPDSSGTTWTAEKW